MLDQISRLLFATFALLVFCYLLFWYAIGEPENGGQHWGFDGHSSPPVAAHLEYANGRFALLAIKAHNRLGTKYAGAPGVAGCDKYPSAADARFREVDFGLIEVEGEAEQAARFAIRYNRTMARELNRNLEAGCFEDELEPHAALKIF